MIFIESELLISFFINCENGYPPPLPPHKDGLNTNRDMAYSLKVKQSFFEIQTRDICTLRPLRP